MPHKRSKWKPWTWFQRGPKVSPIEWEINRNTSSCAGTLPTTPHGPSMSVPPLPEGTSTPLDSGALGPMGRDMRVSSTALATASQDGGGAATATEKRRSGLPPVVFQPLTPAQVENLHSEVKTKREEILKGEMRIHEVLDQIETARSRYLSTKDINRVHYCERELEDVTKCMKKANQTSLERIKAFKAAQAQELMAAPEKAASERDDSKTFQSDNERGSTDSVSFRVRNQDRWLPHPSRSENGEAACTGVEDGGVESGLSASSTSSVHTPRFAWWENTPVIALDALECGPTIEVLQACTRELLKKYTQQGRER